MRKDKEQFTQLHIIIIIIAFIEPVLLHSLTDGTVTHQSINLPLPLPHTQPRYPCTVAGHLTGRLCKCDSRISKRKSNNPFSICICNTFFELLQFCDGLQLQACILYYILGDKYIYYINTSEIPGELSRENLISSHVKIASYLHT